MKLQRSIAALAGLALVLGAGVARAQGARSDINGHKFVDEAQWGKLPAGTPRGAKLYAEGRWHECHGEKVKLLSANEAGLTFFVTTLNSDVQRKLAQNKTPRANLPLVERGSTVRVFGQAELRDGKVVLVVSDVEKLEDDVVRFRRELAALAPGDADGRGRLANQAADLAERYRDPVLKEFADKAAAEELAERLKLLGPDNHAGALELGRAMQARGDRRGAIALFGRVAQATGASAEQKDAARVHLGELEAVRDGETWIPFEQFKAAEGFIRRPAGPQGRWVRREQAELEDEREKFNQLNRGRVVVLRENPMQAGRDAEQRKLSIGQFMEEAREAGGQPVIVRHLQAPDSEGKLVDWAQWIFADGRRAYFIQPDPATPGDLFAWKPAGEAWPSE